MFQEELLWLIQKKLTDGNRHYYHKYKAWNTTPVLQTRIPLTDGSYSDPK